MANNLVSQQLAVLTGQMGEMEPLSSKLDSSISNMQMGAMGSMSIDPSLQQFSVSNQQIGPVETMSSDLRSPKISVSNGEMGLESKTSNMEQHKFLMPNQQVGYMGGILNNPGPQRSTLPSKRKAEADFMFHNPVPLQKSTANKRVAQMEQSSNSIRQSQLSGANKKVVQVPSLSVTPGLHKMPVSANKKMSRNDSISSKSGSQRSQTPKNRSAQMEPASKVQTESSEAVRSKMRESLASALALVNRNQGKGPNEETNSQNEAVNTPKQMQEHSQLVESTSISVDAASHVPQNTVDGSSNVSGGSDKFIDGDMHADASTNETVGNSVRTYGYSEQVFQCDTVFPNEDISFGDNFFVKDELLQGNGLSWAFDFDMQMVATKEAQAAEKPKQRHGNVGGDGIEQAAQSRSPQNLAFQIESELFKLFGGVNKKYKEKGRSLLFNLKDPNNPELRERVMAGEIAPERLCSMSAEELASKELSQWRIAKAEELAQMIVLPETDGDRRRLVKKTHKGEYQVEVEQDDGYSVEVSVGTSLTDSRPKKDAAVDPAHKADEVKEKKVIEQKSSSENQDPSCRLTIPNDGTDLMQGLMVDELKDAAFLPPIVSLDEFMESLNSEPPFENLTVNAEQSQPAEKDNSETGIKLVSSDPASEGPVDSTLDKADKADIRHEELDVNMKHAEPEANVEHSELETNVKYTELDVNVKSSKSPAGHETSSAGSALANEHVWQGALQLNISTPVTVTGLFKSGERTSTKEWPSSLEIKGRVRLDAFEKFLQGLPMSRSRAVMVVHFVLKEESSESERASLCEVVDSYVLDERLGIAEPATGVELYLCPPHAKILEILTKHLSKDNTDAFNSTYNGLIGVVVWRRALISSAISPNSSSPHKHGSKRQHFTSRKHQEKDSNINTNMAYKGSMSLGRPPGNPQPPPNNDDDDDDIPPGFGPLAGRDEDDLPEFNFSGNLNPSLAKSSLRPAHQAASRPEDQMRELVHKYGKTGANSTPRNWQDSGGVSLGIEPWNDDDEDDDIPEWQPQAPPGHGLRHTMQSHVGNQHIVSAVRQQPLRHPAAPVGGLPLQHPMKMKGTQTVVPSWQQGLGYPPAPQALQPGGLGSQPNVGQLYGGPVLRAGHQGMDWRQDAPRSRGF